MEIVEERGRSLELVGNSEPRLMTVVFGSLPEDTEPGL